MSFPCDASSSSSPLSTAMGAFLAQDALLIGIPWRWNQCAAVRGPRDTPGCRGERFLVRVQAWIDFFFFFFKSALKYCSFCLKIHMLASPGCRRVGRSALSSVCAQQHQQEQQQQQQRWCHSAHYFKSREYYFTRLWILAL